MAEALANFENVAWKPCPGGQLLAMTCPASDILLHGNRGGGKTETMLAMFLRYVGKGYGSAWTGVFFRCEFKHLGDVVRKAKIMIPKIFPTAKWKAAATEYKWVFETGEELLFRHAKTGADYDAFHGWELPFQAYDELTKWPTMDFKNNMKSCMRSSFPGIPKLQVSGTNPSGILHNEVRADFIDMAAPGVPFFGDDGLMKVHIKLSFLDNPYIAVNDPEYVQRLKGIKDPFLRKAWLFGDWNIVSGGAFDDLFDRSIHVYDPGQIVLPSDWPIRRGFDWGQSAPFSFGWNRICPHDTVIRWDEGTKHISKGTMFREFEFYGAKEGVKNTGLRWTNEQMADKAVEIETTKWGRGTVKPGAADSAIFADPTQKQKDMYQVYKKKGIKFVPSVKGPGSLMTGMSLFRDRLDACMATTMEQPGIFISSNCRQAIKQIPLLKRDEKNIEQVDSDQEDHLYDEMRYQFQNYDQYGASFRV
jgi:hypothetical protein